MENFFKSIGIIFILLILRFFYNIFNESGKNVSLNKIKKDYNSLEEFLDFYFVNLNENEKRVIYKNHFQDYEYCSLCKEEKESINPEDKKDFNNKLNQHIIVEYYISDKESWRHLCGREGYNFICSKHDIKVHYLEISMN